MSPTRRVIIVLASVGGGSVLSYFIYKLRRGGAELTPQDKHSLLTNIAFSIAIILGVGFTFLWNKKKDL
jgi:O-antigen/teichoic acid export membrane protein